MKRKICVVVASRANYGRVKYLLKAIKEHPELELHIIAGASLLLDRFGKAVEVLKEDGFEIDSSIFYVVEGETLATQAKSTGLGIIELASAFSEMKPDIVLTVADRFETMATAISSTYLNIPLAHLQGGEISGNIDDRVRHSITKLADIHFPSTEESKERIIKMGENEEFVFNYGCPAMDILKNIDLSISNKEMEEYEGVGTKTDWSKPYILIVQHPVTTSYGSGKKQIEQTLTAVSNFKDYQKVVLWPNIDAGSDDVARGIRQFREQSRDLNFEFYKNFPPEIYAKILNNASCLIGNSSSFIREGSVLGVPAVVIGDRQEGREHGQNVIFSDYSSSEVEKNIKHQLEHGKYENEKIFGNGDAGKLIANKLAEINLNNDKRNSY